MQLFILKLLRIEQSGSVGRQLKASITVQGTTTSFGFTGPTSRHKTLLNGEPIGDKTVKISISVALTEVDPKYNDAPFSGTTIINIDPNGNEVQDYGPLNLDIHEVGGKGKNKGKTATLSFYFESTITCRKDTNTMTTSPEGLDFIKSIEGVRYKAYKDQAGRWTIGVGHLIRKNEAYLKTETLTDDQVDALLAGDLAAAEKVVNSDIKVCLKQNQFNALVSFVFNIGHLGNDLRKAINGKKSAAEIQAAFNEYVYVTNPKTGKKEVSQGLVNRRQLEANLYLSQ
jgi:lysozyme